MKKNCCRIWVMLVVVFLLSGCRNSDTLGDQAESTAGRSSSQADEGSDISKDQAGSTVPVPFVSYEKKADGAWSAEGRDYRYKIRLEGKMPNAAGYSYYVVLSNRSNVTFEEVSKSLYSSHIKDFLQPEEVIIIELGAVESREARRPMIMVDGFLYFDTGRESTLNARCGVMDGEITSSVAVSEIPEENNQSNFGCAGYGFQYGADDTIELNQDGKWIVFEKGAFRFGNRCFDLIDLSEEAKEWISWYSHLSKEEQEKVQEIPADLFD